MEQDPGVKGPGQEEAWAEAVKARAAEVWGAVLQQARGAIAFVPPAAKKWLMTWESPAMIRNAPSAGPP